MGVSSSGKEAWKAQEEVEAQKTALWLAGPRWI